MAAPVLDGMARPRADALEGRFANPSSCAFKAATAKKPSSATRTQVPAEPWNSPPLLSVRKTITVVWVTAFTVTGVGSPLLPRYQPDKHRPHDPDHRRHRSPNPVHGPPPRPCPRPLVAAQRTAATTQDGTKTTQDSTE
ncbi:hypothetical protein ACIRPX_18575 [Streptomyces sp. NPDC101225]|uniref:hypothetical protein n=1 Tax=Streptomyces sp. NPDC101225 TaxID=3366135 RepID=UPI00382ADDBE